MINHRTLLKVETLIWVGGSTKGGLTCIWTCICSCVLYIFMHFILDSSICLTCFVTWLFLCDLGLNMNDYLHPEQCVWSGLKVEIHESILVLLYLWILYLVAQTFRAGVISRWVDAHPLSHCSLKTASLLWKADRQCLKPPLSQRSLKFLPLRTATNAREVPLFPKQLYKNIFRRWLHLPW